MMETVADHLRRLAYKAKEEEGILRNLKRTWDTWMKKEGMSLLDRIKGFVDVSKGQLKSWFTGNPFERDAFLKVFPQATDEILKPEWRQDDLKIVLNPRHPQIRVLPFEQKKMEFEVV